jgi:hypothetical protein
MARIYDGEGLSHGAIVFAIVCAVLGGGVGFAIMGYPACIASAVIGALFGVLASEPSA